MCSNEGFAMTPEIRQAIQRGKTCAPVGCNNERTCFLLAMECERLYAQLNVAREKLLAAGIDTNPIDIPFPTSENPQPLFGGWEG